MIGYLSKEDRYIIAEFICSLRTDVLIKNDAIRLIDVFSKHKIGEDWDRLKTEVNSDFKHAIVEKLNKIIGKHIPMIEIKRIMNEYYIGFV